MMWSIARRCSSRLCRRCSSTSTVARSRSSTVVGVPDPSTTVCRFSIAAYNIAIRPQAFDLFLEFFEIQTLLLQFALGLLQVPDDLLVLAHVTQDAEGADNLAIRVAQGGGVKRRGDDFPARASWIEPGVAGDAPLHHFSQRRRELARLLRADEA